MMPDMSARQKRGKNRSSRGRSEQGETSRTGESSRRPSTPRDPVTTGLPTRTPTGRPPDDLDQSPSASGAYTHTRPPGPDHNRTRSLSSTASEGSAAVRHPSSISQGLVRGDLADVTDRSRTQPSSSSTGQASGSITPAPRATSASVRAGAPRFVAQPVPASSSGGGITSIAQRQPNQPSGQTSSGPQAGRRTTPGPANPHRRIYGTAGEYEELDSDFKKRKSSFYRVGRVFKLLWPENGGTTADTVVTTRREHIWTQDDRFGEWIFAKIRWFIVVRIGNQSCGCVPIVTYDGRGLAKRRVNKSEHAIVYVGEIAPDLFPDERPVRGEKVPRRSLRILQDNPEDNPENKLELRSRVDYGRTYTVEHNVKAKNFGLVHPDFEAKLIYDWRRVYTGSSTGGIPHMINEEGESSEDESDSQGDDGSDTPSPRENFSRQAGVPNTGRTPVAMPGAGSGARRPSATSESQQPLYSRGVTGIGPTGSTNQGRVAPPQQSTTNPSATVLPSIPEINSAAILILSPLFPTSRDAALALRNAVVDRQQAHSLETTGTPQNQTLAFEAAVSAIMLQGRRSQEQAKQEMSSVVQARKVQAATSSSRPVTAANRAQTSQSQSASRPAGNPSYQPAMSSTPNNGRGGPPGAHVPQTASSQAIRQTTDEDEASSEEDSSSEEDGPGISQQRLPLR